MKKFKVALQLYSVRDHLEKDLENTLKKVKEAGYDYVELAGPFDRSAEEIKALLDKYSIEAISVHNPIKNWQDKGIEEIEFLKKLGVKYCAIPWQNVSAYHNDWEGTIKTFRDYMKDLKGKGISILYHNHDFEFEKIDGEYIFDKLYSAIPEMDPEIDTCWVRYGGEDPASYIKKYAGRVALVHLKDFSADKLGAGPVYDLIGDDNAKKPSKEENNFKFRSLGEGMMDFSKVLSACEEAGTEYVIVEQDESYDEDSLECAKRSREYLKKEFSI